MLDEELVLRFCAFRWIEEDPQQLGAVSKDMLSHLMFIIERRLSDEALAELAEDFARAMRNSFGLFGGHAFRKWPLGDDRLRPFNTALFESWSALLAPYDWSQVEPHASVIIQAARERMTSDARYIESISRAVSSRSRVDYSFQVAHKILTEALA